METVLQKTEGSQEITRFNFFDKEQFEVMQRVCKLFAKSELVPDLYKESKDNPLEKAMANCMIALEIASRIGASPLMVMQNLVIIYGKPSWSSKFLIATVNTCGRFNPLKFKFTNLGKVGKVNYVDYVYNPRSNKKEAVMKEFDGTSIDNIQCIAYTSPKGSNEILESSPVDIRLAIKEGWYTKNGSKWQTMTQQMLMYRAASFWTSVYAPELSMGMKTEDEIRDIIDIDYEEVDKKEEKKPVIDIDKTEINEKEKEPVKNTNKKTVEVKEEKKDESKNGKDGKKKEKEIKNDVIIDDKGKEILFGENKNLFTENPPF
mgnify:CR=1 FL=1|jgi:hypothetical protein